MISYSWHHSKKNYPLSKLHQYAAAKNAAACCFKYELRLNVAAKIVANNELRIEGIGKKKALGAIKAFSESASQQVFGSHFFTPFQDRRGWWNFYRDPTICDFDVQLR